jgi:hypothetical protein
MLIVLEGIDGSGKTTAVNGTAQRLARSGYNVLTAASGPPAGDDLVDEYLQRLSPVDSPRKDGEPPTALVVDRLHWGEAVYGPKYRPDDDVEGYGCFGKAGFRYLELFIASRGGVTAYIDTKPDVARARINARDEGEDFIDLADLESLHARYDEVYRESNTGIRIFGNYDPATIVDAVVSNALARNEASDHLSQWPSYIGTIRPSVLVAMPADRKQRLSLISKLTDIEWPHVGIVNSAMPSEHLVELADALGNPSIRVLTSAAGGPAHEHATGAVVPIDRRTRFDSLDALLEGVRIALHAA